MSKLLDIIWWILNRRHFSSRTKQNKKKEEIGNYAARIVNPKSNFKY